MRPEGLQLPDPDVAETDRFARVAVRLQAERSGAVLHHARESDVLRGSEDRRIVL